MRKKDLIKAAICSVMVLNLTVNSVVKAEYFDEQPINISSLNEGDIKIDTANNIAFENLNNYAQNNAGENLYDGTVKFIGQWTNESTKKEDSEKIFKNPKDKLGEPLSNPGLFRGVAKTFLGWSDKPPVENGKVDKGARLFSKEDTIETAFPNGIPNDAKLYGVYFSINNPDDPFPSDKISMGLAIISGMSKFKINANKLEIDNGIESENILPDTKLFSEKSENRIRTIIDKYSEKDDNNSINEIVLNSEFEMDDAIAMITYKNPHIGYVGPVLSNNYPKIDFKTNDGKTGYTYVDLTINLDDKLIVPEKLYLEFKGYSWRPIYVLDEKNQPLNIFNPRTDESLGNSKDSFNTLVDNVNPNVLFGVETNNNKKFKIRVIIRHGNEKINESSIVASDGKTIAEKILENMELKSISKAELAKLLPSKSSQELNKMIVRVSDNEAREISKTQGLETLKINGNVKGYVVADAGVIGSGWFALSTKKEMEVKTVESNTIAIGYYKGHDIKYNFVSGTENKELPEQVLAKKPVDKLDLANGTVENLRNYDDIIVSDGIWRFNNWYIKNNGVKEIVKDKITVNLNDINIYGEWIFVNKLTLLNEAPILEVEDREIEFGEDLDLKDLIKKVTDKEEKAKGKDLTKEDVKVIDDGGFNKNKSGEYTITFEVSDTDGAKVVKKAKVKVKALKEETGADKPNDNNKIDKNKGNSKLFPNTGISQNSIIVFVIALLLLIASKKYSKN